MWGKVKSLRELFGIELQYAYDCEKKLVDKGLPEMIENANSRELRSALEQHLQETRTQVTRLERVFSTLGVAPDTKKNAVFDELATAAKDSKANIDDPALRDAALIANGNLVEHYEIATYGTLESLARHLGLQEAASLLRQTLNEEKEADAKLTQIAEQLANPQAARAASAGRTST